MTCAHTRLLMTLCRLLHQIPDMCLRCATTAPDNLAEVDFAKRSITIAPNLPFDVWVSTLAHELKHLERGPCHAGDEHREERTVDEACARLLVPRRHLPVILGAADAVRIAAELGIDVQTAALGIDLARRDERGVA